jgi:hypothetical protein
MHIPLLEMAGMLSIARVADVRQDFAPCPIACWPTIYNRYRSLGIIQSRLHQAFGVIAYHSEVCTVKPANGY